MGAPVFQSDTQLSPPLSTHTLPASALKVPHLGCYCGNSDIVRQEVNLEQRGIHLLGRWPRSLILEVVKLPSTPPPPPARPTYFPWASISWRKKYFPRSFAVGRAMFHSFKIPLSTFLLLPTTLHSRASFYSLVF